MKKGTRKERRMVANYQAAIRRRGEKPKTDRQDPIGNKIASLDSQLRRLGWTNRK